MLRTLDLFAGVGLFSHGLHAAGGFETVACCEIDERKRVLLADMVPGVPLYRDIREVTGEQVEAECGAIDVVAGSPPCKDASSANTAGRGVDGDHTGLFFEALRLVRELRPRWVCLENVPGLRVRGADRVLAALEAEDYAVWPLVVGAGHFGAPHIRDRVWILGLAADVPRFGFNGRSATEARGRARHESDGAAAAYADGDGQFGGTIHGEVAGFAGQARGGPPVETRDAGDPDGNRREHPGGRRLGRDGGPAAAVPADSRGAERRQESGPRRVARQHSGRPEDGQEGPGGSGVVSEAIADTNRHPICQQPGRGGGADGRNPAVDLLDDASLAGGAGLAFWQGLAGDHGAQLAALERDVGPAVHLWAGGLGRHIQLAHGLPDKVARFVMSACGDAVVPEIVEAVGRAMLAVDHHLAPPPAVPAGALGDPGLEPVEPAQQQGGKTFCANSHADITP